MRLHRFYVEGRIEEREGISVSSPELVHQWRKVFRLGAGDKVVLFDGSGYDYECELRELSQKGADLSVIEKRPVGSAPKRDVTLVTSLVKKDKLEWVVEKGTELGVRAFAPVVSERSEKKGWNADRARKIAVEASEQSGRGTVPAVHEPYPVRDAIDALDVAFIAFDRSGEPFSADAMPDAPVGVLIGPEGGWTDAELAHFKEKGIPLFSLGEQVLRAETAAIAVAALLLL